MPTPNSLSAVSLPTKVLETQHQSFLQSVIDEYGLYLSVKDICSLLKVSRPAVDRLLHCNEIRAVKIGRQYRVSAEDFVEWFDQQAKAEQRRTQGKIIKHG